MCEGGSLQHKKLKRKHTRFWFKQIGELFDIQHGDLSHFNKDSQQISNCRVWIKWLFCSGQKDDNAVAEST